MEITLSIEDKRNIIEKANKITSRENKENYTLDDLLDIMDDLNWEYDRLEEEAETLKDNVREYYKEKSPYSVYGVSENEFH